MAVITGKQFTFTWDATDYSAQVTGGTVTRSGTTDTIQTLAGTETLSQGVSDEGTVELLYDGGSGFYAALWAAAGDGQPVAVEIAGGDGKWTGNVVVSNVENTYAADGATTCTCDFAGALTFAAVTP